MALLCEDLETDKPFSDIRRLIHDETNRHSGLHGHTGRRYCKCHSCFTRFGNATTLQRSEVAVTRSYAYLDTDKEYGTPRTSSLAQPYKLTAFEVESELDSAYSCNRDRAWETVPKALAEYSVGVPSVRKLKNGQLETCYHLQPTHALLPDPAVAAAEDKLASHIHEIRRHKPKLWAIVPTEPPETVRKPLLKAVLQCIGNRVPQTATVRCNQPSAFWNVSTCNGHPLTLDLGSTCLISAISTQGRHPATRRYPHVYKDSHDGQWKAEDAEYRHSASVGQYQGPWFTVRTTADTPTGWCNSQSYHTPAWVSRYELLWRADGGRQWHSLGIFVGNGDEMSEVTHAFGTIKGGLRARYLRVRPLECEGGGAIRVGVYGERTIDKREAARRVGRSMNAGDTEGAGLVQYKLTTAPPGEQKARHFVTDGNGLSGGGWWLSRDNKANRCHRRIAAVREAANDEGSDYWEDREYLRGEYSEGDGVESEDAATNMCQEASMEAGMTLQEREELSLALAISASLAEAAATEAARTEPTVAFDGELRPEAEGAGDEPEVEQEHEGQDDERMSMAASEEWTSVASSVEEDEWQMAEID